MTCYGTTTQEGVLCRHQSTCHACCYLH